MAKLYIPTSTLNFNNILSSESISPKAFYSIRGFGYPRWTEVEENNNENVIMLYSQPFSFVRPKSDMEDHPMLVEIVTEESFPMVSDGIFYCDHTLYLSPWRTRFVFFSHQDKLVTLSLSDSSLETKMLALYSQRLLVQGFPLKKVEVLEISWPLNKEAVEYDFRINRMKGFLYGYYIGALLSNSQEIVKKANILQELRNIFSSILSTESRTPTILQHEKLENLFNEIQKSIPIVNYLQSIKKESICIGKIISDLTELGYGFLFPSKVNSVEDIIQSLKYATDGNNYALDWLNGEEQKLNQSEQRNRVPLQVSAEEVVMVNNSLSKISNSCLREDNERALVRAWCNEVFALKEYNGKVSTFAESLSDEVTRKAKAVYGDSWEDSYSKSVLNQMRRYVRAQESNISWQDDLFSSIAAVIAKGSDWEQLRKFMQSKLMSDYKIAFAFFGELNGFANLTRDFTDLFFRLSDKKYIASVYCAIYRQLIGEEPTIEKKPHDGFLVENKLIDETGKTVNLSRDAHTDEPDDYTLHVWQQEILTFAKKEAIKKDKKRLMNSLSQAFLENGHNTDFFSFITILSNYDGWTPTGKGPNAAWIRMQEHFVPDYYSRVGGHRTKLSARKNKNDSPSFFDFTQEDSKVASMESPFFYEDSNAWNYIEEIVPEMDREKLHKDLIWFQEQIQKPKAERYKYYQTLDERNNEVIIDKFCHLKEKPDKKGRVQAPYFTPLLRQRIKDVLNKKYCDK